MPVDNCRCFLLAKRLYVVCSGNSKFRGRVSKTGFDLAGLRWTCTLTSNHIDIPIMKKRVLLSSGGDHRNKTFLDISWKIRHLCDDGTCRSPGTSYASSGNLWYSNRFDNLTWEKRSWHLLLFSIIDASQYCAPLNSECRNERNSHGKKARRDDRRVRYLSQISIGALEIDSRATCINRNALVNSFLF